MKNNIEIALVLVILVSLTPMLVEFGRHRRQAKRAPARAEVTARQTPTPAAADAE